MESGLTRRVTAGDSGGVCAQEANRIGTQMMSEAGVAVLDLHAVTHGREDRSHDGTHYWNQVLPRLSSGACAREVRVRIGEVRVPSLLTYALAFDPCPRF